MSQPTHNLVYTTGKRVDNQGNEKEYTRRVGAAWLTENHALFVKTDVPITILPGDDNFKILPRKKDENDTETVE